MSRAAAGGHDAQAGAAGMLRRAGECRASQIGRNRPGSRERALKIAVENYIRASFRHAAGDELQVVNENGPSRLQVDIKRGTGRRAGGGDVAPLWRRRGSVGGHGGPIGDAVVVLRWVNQLQ